MTVRDFGTLTTPNFADTAALIKALDLVVTVDTAIAHVAGALGVPVWVMLPYASDSRWLTEREDTPWYPTMWLFRQSKLSDWTEVFARIAAALEQWRDRGRLDLVNESKCRAAGNGKPNEARPSPAENNVNPTLAALPSPPASHSPTGERNGEIAGQGRVEHPEQGAARGGRRKTARSRSPRSDVL